VPPGKSLAGSGPAGERGDDEGDGDDTGPGLHVGEVGDPAPVRGRGDEVAVRQVLRPFDLSAGQRGDHASAADRSGDAELAHQAPDGETAEDTAADIRAGRHARRLFEAVHSLTRIWPQLQGHGPGARPGLPHGAQVCPRAGLFRYRDSALIGERPQG
jgi:hypothetical protein